MWSLGTFAKKCGVFLKQNGEWVFCDKSREWGVNYKWKIGWKFFGTGNGVKMGKCGVQVEKSP